MKHNTKYILITNKRTRWPHNEREIFILQEAVKAKWSIVYWKFRVHCVASKCVYLEIRYEMKESLTILLFSLYVHCTARLNILLHELERQKQIRIFKINKYTFKMACFK